MSQKPQRARISLTKQSCHSVSASRQNRHSACLSVFSAYFLYFLPFIICPLYLTSVFTSVLHSFCPFFLPSFLSSLSPSTLLSFPYFIFPFTLSSFLFSLYLPFFPSSFPTSILCIIVWTQLCALHTFCFMWLQPHVLLLFGQLNAASNWAPH